MPFDLPAITTLCHRWFITRLLLYGSILRADFTAASDIDILVETATVSKPGKTIEVERS